MIDLVWARAFAADWIDSWNSADIERILAHYTDDFAMTSPYIVELYGIADGTLRGKDKVRAYWSAGLAIRPALHFELIDVYAGVDSVAIRYRSTTRGRIVIEYIRFNAERLGTVA